MPDFLHAENLSDRERLQAFPAFVQETIERALESKFVSRMMLQYLVAAWQEILAARELERIRDRLRDAKDSDLRAHGLLGAQFEAKRRNVVRWYDRFLQTPR